MENGWIKLHRKLLENPFAHKANSFSLWVTLLLLANHKENKFMWNGKIIVIKDGQFITGRKELSKQTGIPQTTIERILEMLENGHQIEQQKTTKYRLITIVNWDEYQKVDSKVDNKRTTNGQQTDTNNIVENEKNERNNIAEQVPPSPFSLEDELTKLEENSRRDLNIIAFYFRERKTQFKDKEQFNIALKRHLRPAKELSPFSDEQIATASIKAKKDYPEWTIETLVKILTK